ncbi:hypothetical protein DRO53_05590, partial [Candidatus Bathyarchaeota archaeon]
VKGLQIEVEGFPLRRKDFVEVLLGNRFFPGFFGWIIPAGQRRVRLGLAVRENLKASPRFFLEKALKEHPYLSRKAGNLKALRAYGGSIPLHGPAGKTWHPRGAFLVGDAAGQVKSTTGGGVYFSLLAGRLAGEAAAQTLENEPLKALKGYEKAWRKAFGRELSFTSKVRKMLDSLSDGDLDLLFRLAANPRILETVEAYGDTAYQSKVFQPLVRAGLLEALKKPEDAFKAVKILIKALKGLI